jgi:hypothetical protein
MGFYNARVSISVVKEAGLRCVLAVARTGPLTIASADTSVKATSALRDPFWLPSLRQR